MLIGIDASRAVTQQRTGTEAYAYFLIEALIPEAVAAGHHLRLYFNQPPPAGLFAEAERVTHVVLSWPRLWTHLRLAQHLHRQPPDLFFTPAHVIPYSYRKPSVATIHDLGYHHFPQAHTWQQRLYLQWSTRHNSRVGRYIVADSEATKRDLIRFYDVPSYKIHVIYPGIDPNLRPVDVAGQRLVHDKYGIQRPYFLYLSTLQPRKNVVRLIDAYAASGVSQQLVLAGKVGWRAQPILNKIATLPARIAKRIVLTGFVPDAEKGALLSGATALLYPSLYEGFGFPAIEAQVCETAVLCANSSSLPEIVVYNDIDSALLVDPLDSKAIQEGIQRLATDVALRQHLVQRGLVNAQRFNWQQAAQQLLSLLT